MGLKKCQIITFLGQLGSFVFLDLRSKKVISTKILKFKKLQRHKVNIKRKVKLRRLFVKKTQRQSCESLYYPKSGDNWPLKHKVWISFCTAVQLVWINLKLLIHNWVVFYSKYPKNLLLYFSVLNILATLWLCHKEYWVS